VFLKWFRFPDTLGLMLLPLATVAAGVWVWRAAKRVERGNHAREWHAFAATAAIFFLSFAGLAYSLFPFVIIERMTIWDAAAHPTALSIVLYGATVVVPLIAAYTLFSYFVFRGKARPTLYE
jgi:cytochrome d ubiquinol oxidase subunit II